MEHFIYRYKKDKILLQTVFIYPNTYFIGMSSLGFQFAYHKINENPEILCERAFLDSRRENNFVTIESNRNITEFPILFFSISYEPDLLNMIYILKTSGIELLKEKRKKHIIIVGGIAVPLLKNYLKFIADVIVCSPAEYAFKKIIPMLLECKDKDIILDKLQNIHGIYVSEKIKNDELKYYQPEGSCEIAHSAIISEDTEFSSRALIEISKGCLFRCRFCLVSNMYGRYIAHPKSEILKIAEKYKGKTNRIGLIAATLSNHPNFKEIIKELNKMNFILSFSAFRIEGLDNELLELILKNENKTLVIAPETGSERLKRLINKNISESTIINITERAFRLGLKRLKLYFMVGFPGEDVSDLDAIIKLVRKLREISLEHSKNLHYIPEFIIDINPLVPKPFTEFQGYPFEEIKILKEKIIYLKKNLRKLGRTFVYGESPKSAFLQYRLSHGLIDFEEVLRLVEETREN